MKIDLTNIPPEGKEIDLKLTPDWWKPDVAEDRIMGLGGPLSAKIKIYPAGNKMVAEGAVSTGLILRCDRCLETYGFDLSTNFRIYVSISPFKGESEIELSEDDLNLDFIDGNFLDTDLVVKEQLILNVPIKTLCSPGCKGLCPVCGCNLNITACSCSSRHEIPLYQKE